MKLDVTDVHDAHGLTFKLVIERNIPEDKQVFEQLRELLSGKFLKSGCSALRSYKITLNENKIEIGISEEMKVLAAVDYTWNPYREDQKFVVLVLQGEPDNYEWDLEEPCKPFECYWCHLDTWGVNRSRVAVYSPEKSEIIMVNVHDSCQEKREKQVAAVPYP